ncbi:MAG: NYN domain-containing protein [Nibricoccus sp.]
MGYEKHLLVDGANILHAWAETRALLTRDRDAARARLSLLLGVIHDAEEIRLTIVFDGRGDELVVERPDSALTFSHVYTPSGTTADDVIERLVAKAVDPSACVVATDDQAERSTAEAVGATWISSSELDAWVRRASARQEQQLKTRMRENERSWKRNE